MSAIRSAIRAVSRVPSRVPSADPYAGGSVPSWVEGYTFRGQFDTAQDRYWIDGAEYLSYADLALASKVSFTRSGVELAYDGASLARFATDVPRITADGIYVEAARTQYISAANVDSLTIANFAYDTGLASVVDGTAVLAGTPLENAGADKNVYLFASSGGGTKYLGMNVSPTLPASQKKRAIFACKNNSGAATWGIGSGSTTPIPQASTLQLVALYDDTSVNTSELAVASGTSVYFKAMDIIVQTGNAVTAPIIGGSRTAEVLKVFPPEGDYDVQVLLSDDSVVEYDAQSISAAGFTVPVQTKPVKEVRGTAIAPL
jgi:hypothetical protein